MERTKQQEIDTYAAFVSSQPAGSYLAAILHDSEGYVEQQIRNDFALPLAGELRETQLEVIRLREEAVTVSKRIEEQKRLLREIESKHRHFEEAIRSIRTDARKLAAI